MPANLSPVPTESNCLLQLRRPGISNARFLEGLRVLLRGLLRNYDQVPEWYQATAAAEIARVQAAIQHMEKEEMEELSKALVNF